MTVAQLIEALQKLPAEAEALCLFNWPCNESDFMPINDVELSDEPGDYEQEVLISH